MVVVLLVVDEPTVAVEGDRMVEAAAVAMAMADGDAVVPAAALLTVVAVVVMELPITLLLLGGVIIIEELLLLLEAEVQNILAMIDSVRIASIPNY